MTAVGSVQITWQGGDDIFCLSQVGNLFSLEEECGAGIALIYHRLLHGTYSIKDVREPIRLGLIGGGKKPDEAMAKVKAHVDANPNGLAPSAAVAQAILFVVLFGKPPEHLEKKTTEAAEKASSAPTAGSDVPSSTAAAPPSAGLPDKPTT